MDDSGLSADHSARREGAKQDFGANWVDRDVVNDVADSALTALTESVGGVLSAMGDGLGEMTGGGVAAAAEGATEAAAAAAGAILKNAGDAVGEIAGNVIGGILDGLGS